jgi:hypothetical protein
MTWYLFLDLWGRGRNSSELAAGFFNQRLNKPYGIYHWVKLHVSKTLNCSRSHYSPLRDLFLFKKNKLGEDIKGFLFFILWNWYYCTHQILWKSSSITCLFFLSIALAATAIGLIKTKYHMNYIFWPNTYFLLAPSNNWNESVFVVVHNTLRNARISWKIITGNDKAASVPLRNAASSWGR